MNIDLYYVEGISRIDTPSFNTKNHIGTIQDQEDFFLTKKVKTIENTFYPPHYRDQIKFDKEDLVITDNVNYLSFEYGNKIYYYFIDKIDYTSTGVILLDISMDVIQTYMFDTYISSGIIERKFINRWDSNNKINRNYVRENVSDGLYIVKEYYEIPLPKREMMIVTKWVDVSIQKASIVETINLPDDVKEVVYPSSVNFQPYTDEVINKEGTDYEQDVLHLLHTNAADAKVSEVYLIPFKGIAGINYGSKIFIENGVNNLDTGTLIGISPKYLPYGTAQFNRADFDTYLNRRSYTFNFQKNISKNVVFSSNYEPVLMDENYIQVLFGSRSTNTTYPLYQHNTSTIYYCYYASFLTGSRFYYISTQEDNYKDIYRTLVNDVEPIKLDLLSDTYAQFNATNKYRWLEAVGSAVSNVASMFINVGAKASFAKKDIMSVIASPRSYSPKRGQFTAKAQRALKSIERGYQEDVIAAGAKAPGLLMPFISQGVEDLNKMHAPDSIKQSGTMTDIANKSYQLFYSISKVNDYEQCAQYYHRNGYLVNEYVTQVSNIFNSVKNRYYFDMLKMSIPEVHLHNVIEDEDTIGLIEERLEQGLRLWNVLNTDVIIGDFTYDNVENDYLS